MDHFRTVGRLVVDGVRQTGAAASGVAGGVAKRGKLVFVSKVLGRVEESQAPDFDARRDLSVECERVLGEAHKRFDRISAIFIQLSNEVLEMTNLIESFRAAAAATQELALEEAPAGSAPAEAAAAVAPVSADAERAGELVAKMEEHAQRLVHLAQNTGETLRHSCAKITSAAVQQAHRDASEARSNVRESQIALDLARNDYILAQEQLENIEAVIEEFRAGGGGQGATRTIDGVNFDVDKARQTVSRREARLENAQAVYDAAVDKGIVGLSYSLEQTHMAAWSSFNVFYKEVSNFFTDAAPSAEVLASSIRDLKNLQAVAKRLTRERQERMAREREEGELRATPPPAPGPSDQAPAEGGATATATSFFDPVPTPAAQTTSSGPATAADPFAAVESAPAVVPSPFRPTEPEKKPGAVDLDSLFA